MLCANGRKDLKLLDYRSLYRELRNYLAGQHLGSTRDEALLQEVVKTLLCKAELDSSGGLKRTRAAAADYKQAWGRVRGSMPRLLGKMSSLSFEDPVLEYVDILLSSIDLHNPDHDPWGDLYEVFMGSLARGQQGQFFTPANAVQLLVDLVDPRPGETVLDPACGAGSFLAACASRMARTGEELGKSANDLWGIDKDAYLSNLSALRLALLIGHEANITCGDSLSWRSAKGKLLTNYSHPDVILTNPPFGSKIVATSIDVQGTFSLGYKWILDKASGRYQKTDTLQRSLTPQVAFIERCIELLKPGGRLGMVIPESLLSGESSRHVVQFVRDHMQIRAVIGMPENLFKTSGSGGTHTKTCLLVARKRENSTPSQASIFMAEVKWCGNDSRGRRGGPDELPQVADRYRMPSSQRPVDHLSYEISTTGTASNILVPRYHDPEVSRLLDTLKPTHNLVSIDSLIKSRVLEVRPGHEIGRLSYGSGTIPFVRTSDISNWEIKLDPKHGVSEEIYASLAPKQDVREGDILMVRDGTYLIGTCAYVTKYDQKIVYQSHVVKLRVLKPDVISPYLLLAALTSIPVKRQITAKRFTADIIDSLGSRVKEIMLPVPKDPQLCAHVVEKVRSAISERMEARELARQACVDLIGAPLVEDDLSDQPI
jgi:type I restriction enzyme M protein